MEAAAGLLEVTQEPQQASERQVSSISFQRTGKRWDDIELASGKRARAQHLHFRGRKLSGEAGVAACASNPAQQNQYKQDDDNDPDQADAMMTVTNELGTRYKTDTTVQRMLIARSTCRGEGALRGESNFFNSGLLCARKFRFRREPTLRGIFIDCVR